MLSEDPCVWRHGTTTSRPSGPKSTNTCGGYLPPRSAARLLIRWRMAAHTSGQLGVVVQPYRLYFVHVVPSSVHPRWPPVHVPGIDLIRARASTLCPLSSPHSARADSGTGNALKAFADSSVAMDATMAFERLEALLWCCAKIPTYSVGSGNKYK